MVLVNHTHPQRCLQWRMTVFLICSWEWIEIVFLVVGDIKTGAGYRLVLLDGVGHAGAQIMDVNKVAEPALYIL